MTERFSDGPIGSAAIATPRAEPATCPVPPVWRRVITRGAQIGFLFFLVKGLIWIAVGLFVWMGVS